MLLRAGDEIDQPETEVAARAAFDAVFSTLVLRTACGPAFVTSADDEEQFLDSLTELVRRCLFRP